MTIIEEYNIAVKHHLQNPEKITHLFEKQIESPIVLSFWNCLNQDFILFEQIKMLYEGNDVDRNSLEYFVYLESELWRRHNLNSQSKTYGTRIISQDSKLLCEEALNLYSGAFVASYLLANYYEINKEYSRAKRYIENIYNFTELPTQNSIKNMIYINSKLKDWKSVEFHISQINNPVFRISINFAILMERYFTFRLVYFLPLLILFIFIKSWLIPFIIFFFLISLWIYLSWRTKNQLIRKASIILILDIISILLLSGIIRAIIGGF